MPGFTRSPQIVLWPLLLLFVALSLADFALTWRLVVAGGHYEANPVAGRVLASAGWVGLALYKAGATALVAGIVLLVRRRRPGTAVGVLALGCAALAMVVAYSTNLAANDREIIAAEQSEDQRLTRTLAGASEYRDAVARLSVAVITGAKPLAAAADELFAAGGPGPDLEAAQQRLFPGLANRERLAAALVLYAVGNKSTGSAGARRLLDELIALCGRPLSDQFDCIRWRIDAIDGTGGESAASDTPMTDTMALSP